MKELSGAERKVMDFIWERGAVDSGEIIAYFRKKQNWKMTTVSTFLKRLCDKEYVQSERVGRTFRYTPLVVKEDYLKVLSQSMIRDDFGGSVCQFMAAYSESVKDPSEIDALKKWFSEKFEAK